MAGCGPFVNPDLTLGRSSAAVSLLISRCPRLSARRSWGARPRWCPRGSAH